MSSPSIICVAIVVLLSTSAIDGANAKGTFRLQGAWPSSSAHNNAIENSDRHFRRSGSEQFAHVPHRPHHH
jgi:hypothetical protein